MNLKELNQQIWDKMEQYPKHNRHLVEIKKSQIPGAGLGLFAQADIPKGTLIDVYYGRRLKNQDLDWNNVHHLMYLMEIDDEVVIDGGGEYKNFISFCNDARGLTRVKGIRNNCYFDHTEDKKNMALITSRNIKAGEELFVYYGSSYWRVIDKFIKEGLL